MSIIIETVLTIFAIVSIPDIEARLSIQFVIVIIYVLVLCYEISKRNKT